jgi:hypothetical protein
MAFVKRESIADENIVNLHDLYVKSCKSMSNRRFTQSSKRPKPSSDNSIENSTESDNNNTNSIYENTVTINQDIDNFDGFDYNVSSNSTDTTSSSVENENNNEGDTLDYDFDNISSFTDHHYNYDCSSNNNENKEMLSLPKWNSYNDLFASLNNYSEDSSRRSSYESDISIFDIGFF